MWTFERVIPIIFYGRDFFLYEKGHLCGVALELHQTATYRKEYGCLAVETW